MTSPFLFFKLNKNYILLLTILIILSVLLVFHSIALNSSQLEAKHTNQILGITLHLFSIKMYELTGNGIDYAEMVQGNEDRYCEAIEGIWNEDSRECLNISAKNCRLITGTMVESLNNNELSCYLR